MSISFTNAWALPVSFEIWFLSPNKNAAIKLPPEYRFFKSIAENKVCQKYGEYCFDPQIGLYKEAKDGEIIAIGDEAAELEDTKLNKESQENIKVHKSNFDHSLIDCKKDNHFDIFCGKEMKAAKNKSSVEVWIDTSSSLRTYDPTDKSQGCRRKSFAVSIKKECGDEVDLYAFNTQKTYQMGVGNFCMNYGLNDEERLIRWIKESSAKHLVVITDITEYTSKLADFLTANNGYSRGTETEDIVTNEKMLELVGTVAKYCKKK